MLLGEGNPPVKEGPYHTSFDDMDRDPKVAIPIDGGSPRAWPPATQSSTPTTAFWTVLGILTWEKSSCWGGYFACPFFG